MAAGPRPVLVALVAVLAATAMLAPVAATSDALDDRRSGSHPATAGGSWGIGVDSASDSAGIGGGTADDDGVCAGHISEPADGVTVVSVQGARVNDSDARKRPARIVAFGPAGDVLWVHHASEALGVVWSYDVDPMDNGNLFVTATRRGTTLLYELNTTTGEPVWTEELNLTDTHDADYLGDGRIVIANMRNYNESSDTNEDRIVVYDRTTDEFVWEFEFDRVLAPEKGGDYEDDWTHVNDVDAVGDDMFLASVRNFDSVLLIDRDTKEVVRRLGRDSNHDILHKQHNPDYLESDSGDVTFLVADSENDRVVEYRHTLTGWTRTWSAGSSDTLSWPRDADRLPNGNTLVADSKNDRVVEITPTGEVVWEVYAPWLVYDVERVQVGDSSHGPTMADLDAGGDYQLSTAAPPGADELEACAAHLDDYTGGFGSVETTPTASPTTSPEPGTGSGTPTGSDGSSNVSVTTGDGTLHGLALSLFAIAVLAVFALRRR